MNVLWITEAAIFTPNSELFQIQNLDGKVVK